MPPFNLNFPIETFRTISELRENLADYRVSRKTIGLVPTMGALHEGHMSLVRKSIEENDVTVVTIFVNPTQFNNPDDLRKYPRNRDGDESMLGDSGVQILFCPEPYEMYDDEVRLGFRLGEISEIMEGRFRPGHFNGVALVVTKLFNIVRPDRAYFGQKDLQQFAIIQQLNRELRFGIELRRMPIVREASGLAMSSRNGRLSEKGLVRAANIFRVLNRCSELLLRGHSIKDVRKSGWEKLESEGLQPEYLEVVDAVTLKEFENQPPSGTAAICVAAYLEEVRLIDNTLLPLQSN